MKIWVSLFFVSPHHPPFSELIIPRQRWVYFYFMIESFKFQCSPGCLPFFCSCILHCNCASCYWLFARVSWPGSQTLQVSYHLLRASETCQTSNLISELLHWELGQLNHLTLHHLHSTDRPHFYHSSTQQEQLWSGAYSRTSRLTLLFKDRNGFSQLEQQGWRRCSKKRPLFEARFSNSSIEG